MLWSWRFDRNLAQPIDWFQYYNPDAGPDDIAKFEEQQAQAQEPAPQNRLLNILNANNRPNS